MRDAAKAGRPPGRIVNIISTAGLYGNFGQAAYAAAKAGLVGLTRVVAMDMARSKVNCNAVAPFAATRVTESIQPANDAQAAYKARALTVPAGYVARLVAYLCASGLRGDRTGVRRARPRGLPVLAAAPGGAHRDAAALPSSRRKPRCRHRMQMRDHFTDLSTDLEAFNTEPIL